MIVYSVRCAKDHVFDEWFDSMADYDAKAAAGEVVCPTCGDRRIEKALMAPNVAGGAKAPAGPCGGPMCASGCALAD